MSKDSDEALKVDGIHPGPMTEIKFWEAKCMNLESLFEQMKADTTKKMASILEITDSAYKPVFRSMFRNVVAALNEAQDITMFLKPLGVHFEVRRNLNCWISRLAIKILIKILEEFHYNSMVI